MTKAVAAIFAHPDDEILACGGAMALHADRGDQVRILLLATGATSRGGEQTAYIAELQRQAEAAAAIIGATAVTFADFPDNRMDSVALLDVVKAVESFLADHRADVIYTHHSGDMNIDHAVVQRAVMTACRPLPGVREHEILAGEVNSSTEWAPASLGAFAADTFVDISNALERKVKALACYKGELRDWPHPRSEEGLRALARWRGTQSGLGAAEAFVTLRRLRHGV